MYKLIRLGSKYVTLSNNTYYRFHILRPEKQCTIIAFGSSDPIVSRQISTYYVTGITMTYYSFKLDDSSRVTTYLLINIVADNANSNKWSEL